MDLRGVINMMFKEHNVRVIINLTYAYKDGVTLEIKVVNETHLKVLIFLDYINHLKLVEI